MIGRDSRPVAHVWRPGFVVTPYCGRRVVDGELAGPAAAIAALGDAVRACRVCQKARRAAAGAAS